MYRGPPAGDATSRYHGKNQGIAASCHNDSDVGGPTITRSETGPSSGRPGRKRVSAQINPVENGTPRTTRSKTGSPH